MVTAVIILQESHSDRIEESEIKKCRELMQETVYTEITVNLYVDSFMRMIGYYNDDYAASDDDYSHPGKLESDIKDGEVDMLVFSSTRVLTNLHSIFDNVEKLIHSCFKNRIRILTPQIDILFHNSGGYADLEQKIVKYFVENKGYSRTSSSKIRSGMEKAEEKSKWTGRPPAGFTVNEQSRLTVEPQQFEQIYEGLDEIESGESVSSAATLKDVSRSTLQKIANDSRRKSIYLRGSDTTKDIDPRINSALLEYENSHNPPYQE